MRFPRLAMAALLLCGVSACDLVADGPVADVTVGLGILEFKIDSRGHISVGAAKRLEAHWGPVSISAGVEWKSELGGDEDHSVLLIQHPVDGVQQQDAYRLDTEKPLNVHLDGVFDLRLTDRVTTLVITDAATLITVTDGDITAATPPTSEPPPASVAAEQPVSSDPVTSGCARDAQVMAEGALRDGGGYPLLGVRIWHSKACNRDWGQAFGNAYGRLVVSLPSKGGIAVCLPLDCSLTAVPITNYHTPMLDGDVRTVACATATSPRDHLVYGGCLQA
ncbi:hypothetical protein [Actinokineospora enzanensis]|uniref:hypothetical protein n=1 Tax=Actinokineospora enzanensis TaxID=155975 RepID=UPI0012EC4CB3|nr:hypothetical protein [Actinokineospora enzanensis]